jgi:hypothetical protein
MMQFEMSSGDKDSRFIEAKMMMMLFLTRHVIAYFWPVRR